MRDLGEKESGNVIVLNPRSMFGLESSRVEWERAVDMLNHFRCLVSLRANWSAGGSQGVCGDPSVASVASEPHDILSPRLTVIGLTDARVAPASFADGTLECGHQPMRCRVKHTHKPSLRPQGLHWAGGGDVGGKKQASSLFLLRKHLLTPSRH